jgi:predicted kinase
MACIITYNDKKYSQPEFNEYFKSHFFEFAGDFLNSKADVILPIGTSGSGKSTFIKSLPQENLVVIEPDAMRVEFTGNINNKSKDKDIYEEAAKRAITAIKQGKQVVFDTTNLTKDKRLPFIEAIKKEIPNASIQYKLMELNPELAKQRIKAQIARGENRANVPDSTIDRHAESYKQMLEDIKNEPITEFKELGSKQDIEGFKEFVEKVAKNSELFYQLGGESGVELNLINSILSKLNGFDTYFRTDLNNNSQINDTENDLLKNILINKYNLTEEEYNYLLGLENKSEKKQNFISRLLTAEYSKFSTNDIVINRLKELKNREFDSKLEEKLLDFSKKLGITTEVLENLKESFGVNATGIADILNKIIYLNKNRKLDTLAEEVAHFYVELIGSKEGLGKNLLNKITSWNGYQDVYDRYSTVYLGVDGKPNELKIKKEAVAQAIAEAIVKRYTADSEFATKEEKSFWKSVLDFINSISNLIRSSAYFPLDKLTDDIAKKILSGDVTDITSRIKDISNKNKELKTYKGTIESLPKVQAIIDTFSKLGAKLTGSLALRKIGTLYRNISEKVHDLDFIVDYKSHGGNIEGFVAKIKDKYPNYKPLNDKPYNGNNGELILNGIITNSDELYNKFKNLSGDFNTRLDQFTLEEQSQMLLIDFFFYPEAKETKLVDNVVSPDAIFNAKSNMGMRPKDAFDLLNYVAYKKDNTLSEYSYYQLPSTEGRLLQGNEKKQIAAILGLNKPKVGKKAYFTALKMIKQYNRTNSDGRKISVNFKLEVTNSRDMYRWEIYDSGTNQMSFDFNRPVVEEAPQKSPVVPELLNVEQTKKQKEFEDAVKKAELDMKIGIDAFGDSFGPETMELEPGYLNVYEFPTYYDNLVKKFNESTGSNITGYEFLKDYEENINFADNLQFVNFLQENGYKGVDLRNYNQGLVNFEKSNASLEKNDNFNRGLDPISGIPVPPRC